MRKKIYLIICLAFIAIWHSCKQQEEENLPGTIYGVVTDKATGEPVKSAGVELSPVGLKTITGTDGHFEFTEIVPGNYTLLVTKTNYADYTSNSIEVKSGQTSQGDVQLEKLPAALKIVNDKGLEIDELDFGAEKSVLTRSLGIFNDSPESLEWLITKNCEWITSISKITGTLQPGKQQPVSITIDRKKLSGGENTYILNITSDNGNKELIIKAWADILPEIYMKTAYGTDYTEARLYSEITNIGSPAYKEKGFVISQKASPTFKTAFKSFSFFNDGSMSCEAYVEGLYPRTDYYAKAYITNATDTFYSKNEIKFNTNTPLLPVISTENPTKIHENGATLNGYISYEGRPTFGIKGFVFSSKKTTPTLTQDDGYWITYSTSTGNYSVSLTEFEENMTYYVRAIAITAFDTIYGEVIPMKTQIPYKIIDNIGIRIEDEFSYEQNSYQMTHYYAEKCCSEMVIGKYDDWRLPTLEELKTMYNNRNIIGGFKQDIYWSSTKNKDDPNFDIENSAWREGYIGIDFSNGEINYSNPYAGFVRRVRAVRNIN